MSDIIKRNNSEEGSKIPKRFASAGLPVRKGKRPKMIMGPLHLQCNGHGDPKYLKQLLNEVLSWPYIAPVAMTPHPLDNISIALQAIAATDDSSAFISGTEFARVLLTLPTIIIVLPRSCAHWAVVQGWAEPHFLQSFGSFPVGTLVVYTPRSREELEVCNSLFSEAYYSACKFCSGESSTADAHK
jgi:hypothetical protein